MDAAAELGRNPVSKHQILSLSMDMSRLTRDGTAEPVSRDQIRRHERGQGNIYFPCLADHVQDWQPYPVDPYTLAICVTIHMSYLASSGSQEKHQPTHLLRKKLHVDLAKSVTHSENSRNSIIILLHLL